MSSDMYRIKNKEGKYLVMAFLGKKGEFSKFGDQIAPQILEQLPESEGAVSELVDDRIFMTTAQEHAFDTAKVVTEGKTLGQAVEDWFDVYKKAMS